MPESPPSQIASPVAAFRAPYAPDGASLLRPLFAAAALAPAREARVDELEVKLHYAKGQGPYHRPRRQPGIALPSNAECTG